LATLSRLLLLLLTRLLILLAALVLLASLVWIVHVFPRWLVFTQLVNRRPDTRVPFWEELSVPIRSAASDHRLQMAAGRKAILEKRAAAHAGGPDYLAYMISMNNAEIYE
jgi:hypothetical protein